MTLEEAIQQLITLGEKDPLTIARKIEERHGKEWLGEQMLAYAEDFIRDLARTRLGALRRSSELALRPGDQLAAAELKTRSLWIPDEGWVRANEATAAQLRKKARWDQRLIAGISRRVEWLLEVADLMDAEGAKTLGKLKTSLPALPELPEELAA